MIEYEDLGNVWIGGQLFTGIGYQGLLTVNTKTYVKSPSRANDGSIPNINDHDTFVVPRCKLNFKYLKIEDYQRLCNVISGSNEFPVTYFDKQIGEMVTHLMYCEPEEMKKLFNIGTYVIGVLDYEVSFIGTLNNLDTINIAYNNNGGSGTIETQSVTWGSQIKLSDCVNFTKTGNSLASLNTKADGTGWTFMPNQTITAFKDLTLYAQWE